MNKILPLNDFIEKGIIDASQTTDAFLKTTQDKGIQVGVSNGVNCYGIAYDPVMFAEAGVPEPTQNWTWDDWKNACLTIHDKRHIRKLQDGSFHQRLLMGVSQEDFALNFFAPTNDKLGFDDYTLLTDYIKMICRSY